MYFPEDTPRPAGHLFILPHGRVHSSDKKDRGYVLLNRCTPPANATLAYRSRQITETARYHAPSLPIGANPSVAPAARGYAGRKMPHAATSYVYPGRLLFWNSTRLVRSDGMIAVTKALRDVLASGLGLREDATGIGVAGHRGKLLRTSDATLATLGFRWGIVLTGDQYSAEERWQVVAPVVRDNRVPLAHDVVVTEAKRSIPHGREHVSPARWSVACLTWTRMSIRSWTPESTQPLSPG
jgi:hypothetical protein